MKGILEFLKSFFFLASSELGAVFLDENLAKSQDEFPEQKVNPGSYNTKVKTVVIKKLLDEIIDADDEILGMKLPENAKILDAQLRVDGSTGTGGIFQMGLKAGFIYDEESQNEDKLESFTEDPEALIGGAVADAGGQAVFARMGIASNLLGAKNGLKRVGLGGLQVFVKCTEATTSTDDTPRYLEGIVSYMLEH